MSSECIICDFLYSECISCDWLSSKCITCDFYLANVTDYLLNKYHVTFLSGACISCDFLFNECISCDFLSSDICHITFYLVNAYHVTFYFRDEMEQKVKELNAAARRMARLQSIQSTEHVIPVVTSKTSEVI